MRQYPTSSVIESRLKREYHGADHMRVPRLRSRLAIALTCGLLVLLVGYGDYCEGYENSMLLLYLIPIAIATWYCGIAGGTIIAAFSVAADVVSDVAASVPSVGVWNVITSFVYYLVFLVLLSRCQHLLKDMHRRVEERTGELRREIVMRMALERKISEVAEDERRRLGRELHDSLCQHLTGTALTAQTVVAQLQGADAAALENARKVVGLVDRGIEIARDIARGLFLSEMGGEGLIHALDVLAKTTSHQHQIDCRFHHSAELTMPPEKATQFYWIAREAVRNAVTHANPTKINIGLVRTDHRIELFVEDDGDGIPSGNVAGNGIGLQIMRQRAELAGGRLTTARSGYGGAAVRCSVSLEHSF